MMAVSMSFICKKMMHSKNNLRPLLFFDVIATCFDKKKIETAEHAQQFLKKKVLRALSQKTVCLMTIILHSFIIKPHFFGICSTYPVLVTRVVWIN